MAYGNNGGNLFKLAILGDGGVGKTALTIQLCLNQFVETYDPTIEDSYRKKLVLDGEPTVLEILDTAGQEEYTALRDQWIRDGEGFLLVYSITERNSFLRIRHYYNQICRVKDGEPFGCVLVGNKCDRNDDRAVSPQEGEQLAKEFKMAFYETSAKLNVNAEKAFLAAARMTRSLRNADLEGNTEGFNSVNDGTTSAAPASGANHSISLGAPSATEASRGQTSSNVISINSAPLERLQVSNNPSTNANANAPSQTSSAAQPQPGDVPVPPQQAPSTSAKGQSNGAALSQVTAAPEAADNSTSVAHAGGLGGQPRTSAPSELAQTTQSQPAVVNQQAQAGQVAQAANAPANTAGLNSSNPKSSKTSAKKSKKKKRSSEDKDKKCLLM